MSAPTFPSRFRSWANARTAASTLVAGLVLAVVYLSIVAPWLKDHMGGEKLLDEMFWRTPVDVDTALETYGPDGRELHRNVLLVDLLSPVVYAPPLALSIAFAASKIRWLHRFAHIVPLLPIAGGISDWGENATLLLQANRYPGDTDLVSWIATLMTVMKFGLLIVSVFVIACGLVVHMAKPEGKF